MKAPMRETKKKEKSLKRRLIFSRRSIRFFTSMVAGMAQMSGTMKKEMLTQEMT